MANPLLCLFPSDWWISGAEHDSGRGRREFPEMSGTSEHPK